MSRLLYFLGRVYVILLFAVLELTSVLLFSESTPYTEARAAAISARLHHAVSHVSRFANRIGEAALIRRQNSEYALRIAELENRASGSVTVTEPKVETRENYTYLAAHVVSATIVHPENMITIDRGYEDGVSENSALVTPDGSAVGIIVRCSEHFSVAKSLLNTSIYVSGRLAKDQSIGSVHWSGGDTQTAEFNDLTQYAQVSVGDEVVAAGFSHYFPDGTMIGTVTDFSLIEGRTVYACRIRLHADFSRIRDVLVVHNVYKEEQDELESE